MRKNKECRYCKNNYDHLVFISRVKIIMSHCSVILLSKYTQLMLRYMIGKAASLAVLNLFSQIAEAIHKGWFTEALH